MLLTAGEQYIMVILSFNIKFKIRVAHFLRVFCNPLVFFYFSNPGQPVTRKVELGEFDTILV